ncbi:MAG: homoserine dehydrogenase [Candidatus Hydrogenedentes bacterium]|nr:homoserine dehydrogenase [Candidatus Hydrogenedentota bacterium]
MTCNVGVIGAGTVGGGVIETLIKNSQVVADKTGAEVRLAHVADLNPDLLKDYDLTGVTVSNDAKALIADPNVNVVCELIGGYEPARTFILEALNNGKHVVTANKMLLAMAGPELTEAAIKNGVELRYEAAVAGTIPIIKAIRESLAANNIHAVYGILNGTCNYILTRMAVEGLQFDDVLQQAVDLGFAETPPDLDIEGHDTAHKCQILASLCYSTKVNLDDIYVEGITKITGLDVAYAAEIGYQLKLLAVVRKVNGEIEARVHPTLVANDHLLAAVKYEFNAVYVETDIADATLYYGRGAGKLPTASAVVADVVDIARRGDAPAPAPFRYTHELPLRDIGLCEGRFYLRLTTEDHPGVLGSICSILGKHGVSIASCIQKEEQAGVPAHVILMTHDTQESSVVDAITEIDNQDFIDEATHMIRVLS